MSSAIYSKTGDTGFTSLANGTRVKKTSARIEAYGTIDEANAWIGMAAATVEGALLLQILEFLHHRLYNCSANLALPPSGKANLVTINDNDVEMLEKWIDQLEETSGPIRGFVLPGGTRGAAVLHVARTVCRRAERLICTLAESEKVDPAISAFVNRASDLLFAAARFANFQDGKGDVIWNPGHEAAKQDR